MMEELLKKASTPFEAKEMLKKQKRDNIIVLILFLEE